VAGGRVIGKSDRTGSHPVTSAYTPFDFGATVYQVLGIEPDAEVRDPQGRPSRLNAGTPMGVLFQDR
jgi:hypothetical protein